MSNWTEDQIREKLATDEKWVRRALVRLLERQTSFEQQAETTSHTNMMGFQSCDAKWFTRIAQFVKKYPEKSLSEKQLKIVRRPWRGHPAICKYAGQLLQVMKEDAKGSELPQKAAGGEGPETGTKGILISDSSTASCSYCGEALLQCRCYWKAVYAQREAAQERAAYQAKLDAGW